MNSEVHSIITRYMQSLHDALDTLQPQEIEAVSLVLHQAWQEDRTIFIMGNGGSAATASHIVCDMNKGACCGKQKPFRFISLNDAIPTMLALANDVSYEAVFVEQLRGLLRPGDVVIGISGSGNSPNVLRAIEHAAAHGAVTVGICGYDGGKLKQAARHVIHLPVNDMQLSEDIHLVVGHILMRIFMAVLP